MNLSPDQIAAFQETLWGYYAGHARSDLPWRRPEEGGQFDPYKILVSELMLQQTQVSRVIPKYHAFIAKFPTVAALAATELGTVLQAWQGLGYNRRAKFLWQSAQAIAQFERFPDSLEELIRLPGIGKNTAGAILAYAYNKPIVFIETNIRTVMIHHFARNEENIPDSLIRSLLAQILDVVADRGKEQPEQKSHFLPGAMRKTEGLSHYRDFYWALMDYGSFLKTEYGNASRRSKHYGKQSAFAGSKRQIRGAVIRMLTDGPHTLTALKESIIDDRLSTVLSDLLAEDLIQKHNNQYHL